jgi:hypothetical protein
MSKKEHSPLTSQRLNESHIQLYLFDRENQAYQYAQGLDLYNI